MSYNTVPEADAYFEARYGYDLWAPLDDVQKQQALTSAQQQLDSMCVWYGEPTDPEQGTAFPRAPDTEVPQDVKDAECEIAYNIVASGSTTTTEADPLSELTAGSVTLKFDTSDASATSTTLVNDLTDKILSQYGLCQGTGSTKLVPMSRQ